ncbi:MAG: protein-L-isoaspartate(D-aspartate) O-methyltransferase [Desulfatiglandales bacterium]
MSHDFTIARKGMVKNQLAPRGIKDERVLQVMGKIPRHLFIEEALAGEAYNDHPVPIGEKQTISQPYIVALMTEALELEGNENTLEIGTGSGYQTAILAELSSKVYTIERIKSLLVKARKILAQLGYNNILFNAFDGTMGWSEYAPFDAIMVTAGAPSPPKPLIDQLADNGRMIIPVGDRYTQELIKIVRKGKSLEQKSLGGCRFVNLIGIHGWQDEER